VVALVAVSRLAAADPNPEAEKLFRDGRALLKDGKLGEACDKFTASSHLEPSVGTLLNLGDCRAKLGQTATAWAAFVEASRLAKHAADAPRQAEADRRAAELEPKLSYLTIKAAAPVSGEAITRTGTAIDAALYGQSVPLDPGDYEIKATATGYTDWSQKIKVKPDGDHASIEVPALTAVPVKPVATAPVPAQPAPVVVETSSFTGRRKAGVAIGAVGLVGLGVASVFAFQAHSLEDDARALCPTGQPCRNLDATHKSDDAVSKANIATYASIAGLAAVTAGVVLWVTGAPESHVMPTATRDSAGITVVGRF
jgi:serine/threonine-protein kinase